MRHPQLEQQGIIGRCAEKGISFFGWLHGDERPGGHPLSHTHLPDGCIHLCDMAAGPGVDSCTIFYALECIRELEQCAPSSDGAVAPSLLAQDLT